MWLVFTLFSAVLWGVGQIVIKKGYQNLSPLFNNVLASLLIVLMMIPIALSHGIHPERILSILPLTIVVAIIFLSYYYVIRLGQVAFTGTIISTGPIITATLSIIFLHEILSVFQIVAIGLVLVGIICLAMPEKISEVKNMKVGSWLWWALFTAIILGLADFLIKLLITQSDVYTYLFTYGLCNFAASFLSIFFDKKGRALPSFSWKSYAPTVIGVTIMEVAFVSFHFALSGGLASIVTPISSLYVGITAVLAWLILKEKIDKIHFFGIACAAIGVILVGIS